MSGFLLLTYRYCIEGFGRRQNKTGDSRVQFLIFSPLEMSLPSTLPIIYLPCFPVAQTAVRCTDGVHCEISKLSVRLRGER